MKFKLASDFQPKGDQPKAIEDLVKGLEKDSLDQTLLGVTGSGKTFTMANVIERVQRPTLVISHNKTLAAQLYGEFKEFFPENAVHFFVSYYDYYQPEAYIPRTDTYIEKDASINEEIDQLRHASTSSLFTREDVIVVASVSCIYGIGEPDEYLSQSIELRVRDELKRNDLLKDLISVQYERNDIDFSRGKVRVRGDILEVYPPYEDSTFRIEFFGERIESIKRIDTLTGEVLGKKESLKIFPAKHFTTSKEKILKAIGDINKDLAIQIEKFKKKGKLLEAQRIEQRTNFDIEMLTETGFCPGIENYSLYLSGRKVGEPPYTLLDYFKFNSKSFGLKEDGFLTIIDESHMTIPQIRGMYNGDKKRKETLVEHGFRLPTALDNRPLRFNEFEKKTGRVIYTSATPEEYEIQKSTGRKIKNSAQYYDLKEKSQKTEGVVEQLIRPTGLLDPLVEVRKTEHQIDDLIDEIKKRTGKNQRVLVTTLTKRMAEDLTEYLKEMDIKVEYLHSDIVTLERPEILKNLRLGNIDVVVGINLLREGIDLPEVSLVVILDADKEGFLRSDRSLIQTIGRAARHEEGKVIMYADKITGSMKRAIDETLRRRKVQEIYNSEHGITPKTIKKAIREGFVHELQRIKEETEVSIDVSEIPKEEIKRLIKELEKKMDFAAKNLEFEKAAIYRDEIEEIQDKIKY